MAEQERFEIIGNGEDGDGLVAAAGQARGGERTYVAGALPGDGVTRAGDGTFSIVTCASPARREVTLCPHYPACGGCRVQHMSDAYYAKWKAAQLAHALERQGLISSDAREVRDLQQVPLGSRRRAVFTAIAGSDGTLLGFHEHRSHDLIDLRDCAVLRPSLVKALPFLREIAAHVSRKGEACRLAVLETDHGLDVSVDTTGSTRRRAAVGSAALARIAGEGNILRLTVDGEPLILRAKPVLTVSGVAVAPPPGAFVQQDIDQPSSDSHQSPSPI